MMKRFCVLLLATSSAMLVPVAANASTTITFDEVGSDNFFASINDFYNGGVARDGTVGPSLGVVFSSESWVFHPFFSGGAPGRNLGNAPETNFGSLNSNNPGPTYVNVLAGFTGRISFDFESADDSRIEIYDGLDGTGNLLASAFLNIPTIAPNRFFSLDFSGVARSFRFSDNTVGIDDLTFDPLPPAAGVPEPAAWAMMLTGFGLAGGVLRNAKRRRKTSLTVRYS